MIITTAYDPNSDMLQRARRIAEQVEGLVVNREKYSLQDMQNKYNEKEMIVVEKKQSKYYADFSDSNPFHFHPSMAILRIKQLQKGDNDLLVNISQLTAGESFLDCSLGLGSDAIVAAYVVGAKGRVVGIESEKVVAALVAEGLSLGWNRNKEIDEAMKRVEVIHSHHLKILQSTPSKSFDVVYFDPMFRHSIQHSSSISPLRGLANHQELSIEAIKEAKRVAKRMVILKENTRSNEFVRLGFKKIPRSSSITYGTITGAELN